MVKNTIIGHIPARKGSKRVASKNLRLINGKPMLAYAIEAAIAADVFDEVYVNTDCEIIAELAHSYGIQTYLRDPSLASDTASGDAFTADFIQKVRPETLVMISPVCPLVEAEDIQRAVEAFNQSDCDTLITCMETHMQSFCEGKPLNISLEGPLAPSQDNPAVHILNWAVTVWDAKRYMEAYEKYGYAYIGFNRELLPIDPSKSVKVSTEEDFHFAEALVVARNHVLSDKAEYWSSTCL